MKKLMIGIVMIAIGMLGFILSLNLATALCVAFGAQTAAKCLIATAVFLLITFTGGIISKKEILAEA